MLSRTAFNLFWMARQLERAENIARLLDVGARITLLPNTAEGFRNEWDALLRASGMAQMFFDRYGTPTSASVEEFLFFDRDNPSSVVNCLTNARESGRIVRTALTSQVWDALNGAYQDLRGLSARRHRDPGEMSDFVTRAVLGIHGAIIGTQLRNDGWHFMQLGHGLERADATARILDVKYYVLLPRIEFLGGRVDHYQWQVILRALSLHRAFHWAYGGGITAAKVADFLIMNRESPRSLLTSIGGSLGHLDALAARYGDDAPHVARDKARAVLASLEGRDVDGIFEVGLHEFLTAFIGDVADVAVQVHADYFGGRP